MKLKDLKIGTILLYSFSLILTLVVTIGFVGYYQTERLHNQIEVLHKHPLQIRRAIYDLKSDIWQKHITILTNFWYTISHGYGEYNGSPFAPHMQIQGLHKEAFETWLRLFFSSVDKIFTEDIANKFKERSSIIAGNFMRNLGI